MTFVFLHMSQIETLALTHYYRAAISESDTAEAVNDAENVMFSAYLREADALSKENKLIKRIRLTKEQLESGPITELSQNDPIMAELMEQVKTDYCKPTTIN